MRKKFIAVVCAAAAAVVIVLLLILLILPEARINKMLSQMTMEEKLAQMMMVDIKYFDEEANREEKTGVVSLPEEIRAVLTKYDFGGVALFGMNTVGTESTVRLTDEIQSAALSSNMKIPMLISVDQEGGSVRRLATGTTLTGNMALAATGDEAYARQAAQIIGSELSALGINMNFGPVMDVNSNPKNPIIGIRSFSDDPEVVSSYGKAYVEGLTETGTISCLKHFPGHGDTSEDSHTSLPLVNKTAYELKKLELIPFKNAAQDVPMIMTAHIQFPEIEKGTYISKETGEEVTLPATLSKTIITDILKGELGFNGLVITDALQMDAIKNHFDRIDVATLAINAGVDILLMPVEMYSPEGIADMDAYIKDLVNAVNDGRIDKAAIDAAVKKILKLKRDSGILDYKAADLEAQIAEAKEVVGSRAHHDTEWEIATAAVTQVHNNGAVPVVSEKKGGVLLFATFGSERTLMTYAVDKAVSDGVLEEGIAQPVLIYDDTNKVSDFEKEIGDAETVIAVSACYSAAEADENAPDGYQVRFVKELIEYCHKMGKHIVVLSGHLPYDIPYYSQADALAAVYYGNGMSVVPEEFNGETATYAPNLAAGVYSCFTGDMRGVLPVNLEN